VGDRLRAAAGRRRWRCRGGEDRGRLVDHEHDDDLVELDHVVELEHDEHHGTRHHVVVDHDHDDRATDDVELVEHHVVVELHHHDDLRYHQGQASATSSSRSSEK
jgi:hypothetical protein